MDRGLTPDTLQGYGIGEVVTPLPGHEGWTKWIALPYPNPDSSVRLWRFRRTDEGEPKYMQEPGKGMHLYLVVRSAHPTVWVTEGEFDALLLNQLGYPAVGVPGSTNWKDEWRFLFAHADSVRIVTDADQPGQKLAQVLARSISKVAATRVVELPDGLDVTDCFLQQGEAELRRLIA
jgi:DNA primase